MKGAETLRRPTILVGAIGAGLAIVASGVALASKPTILTFGNVVFATNGRVIPKALPKSIRKPVAVTFSGDISTKDGTHPPALSEGVVEFDRNILVDATGLPACRIGQLEARDSREAKRVCRDAIVGTGHTTVQVEFPEQRPFSASGPLVLFNGGSHGDTTTLYVHAYVSVPAPTALVTAIKTQRINHGIFGLRTSFKLPVIAGGAGSLTHFDFTIHRNYPYRGHSKSYLEGRCSNGRYTAKIDKLVFGATVVSGTLIEPCIMKP